MRVKGHIDYKKSMEMQCGIFFKKEKEESFLLSSSKKVLYHHLEISTKTKTKIPLK